MGENGYRCVAAVRGASGVEVDTPTQIKIATEQLMQQLLSVNNIAITDIISIIFTVTNDLQSANPATVLRATPEHSAYNRIPLLCTQEPYCEGGMSRVIRILLHVNTIPAHSLAPVYINGAERLRPDLL